LIGWKNSPNIKIVANLIYNDIKMEIIEGMPSKLYINTNKDLNSGISRCGNFHPDEGC